MLKIYFISLFTAFLSLSLCADGSYSQAIKEKKIYPMGEKIYTKKCQKIDVESYKSYEDLISAVVEKHLCGSLNQKYLEALSLYLWEKKRAVTVIPDIHVSKDEKCPVCGMFIYKYPKWASQIHYKEKDYSFDGMKDLMKYYFQNRSGIKNIYARDYYSQKTFDATRGYFVVGSDIYGPMGNELIPFAKESDAKRFYVDHKGLRIFRFNEITSADVYKLDE